MKIKTEIQAVIWKINVKIGQKVNIDDVVVILESMKMEIPIESKYSGIVKEILIKEGGSVNEDQEIIILE
jgi:biotin carboxyl carrier protein